MTINKLTISKICKSYNQKQVVKEVSFSIKSNEIIGLLGPNGAGKTTCFYMILGLVGCDKGNIALNQQDITKLPIHSRAKLGLGYLPQEASVFRKLSVRDNILAVLQTRKELSKKQQLEKLDNLLDEFNIKHIKNTKGISLSGGERRRVEIARTIAKEPLFILLDEPFAGIDPISIIDIKNIIKYLVNKGIGIIITDHNVRETLDLCQKALIMSEGQVISLGSPKEVLQNDQVKQVYLGNDFTI